MPELTHHVLKPNETIKVKGRVQHSQIDKVGCDYHVLVISDWTPREELTPVPPKA